MGISVHLFLTRLCGPGVQVHSSGPEVNTDSRQHVPKKQGGRRLRGSGRFKVLLSQGLTCQEI